VAKVVRLDPARANTRPERAHEASEGTGRLLAFRNTNVSVQIELVRVLRLLKDSHVLDLFNRAERERSTVSVVNQTASSATMRSVFF